MDICVVGVDDSDRVVMTVEMVGGDSVVIR